MTLDHLIPRALHGPEDEKNAAWVRRSGNASKGPRRLYEYGTAWTVIGGRPRIDATTIPSP